MGKPAYLLRNEKMMQALFESEIFTVSQAVQALDQWLALYRASPHPTVEGKRKIDVFESGRGPGVDDAQLRYLMMAREVKRIGRNGVAFMGSDYHHEILYGLREPVMIRYEFTDVTRIHIYRRSGEFLCTAERRESFHPMARLMGDAKDMSSVKAGIKQQRSLKSGTMKIAEKIIASGISKNLLNQIPYALLPASVPFDIERIQGEIEAEAKDKDEGGRMKDEKGKEEKGAEIIVFDCAVDKYHYLSTLKRELTDEEKADLEDLGQCKAVKELKAYG
jgi:putative transposase